MTRKKNPPDLTKRNNDARKRKDASLDARLKRLEKFLNWLYPGWRKNG